MRLCLVLVLVLPAIFRETHSHAHHYRGKGLTYQRLSLKSPMNTVPLEYGEYERCRHQICMSAETYPEEEIKYAMKNKDILRNLFGNVLNSNSNITEIGSRFNLLYGESSQLCDVDGPHTYQPKVLRNQDLKWKYIVNLDEYRQSFTAELCIHTETFLKRSDTRNYCNELGFSCVQDYQDIFLLTYEQGNIEFDKFSIPTTCSCACA